MTLHDTDFTPAAKDIPTTSRQAPPVRGGEPVHSGPDTQAATDQFAAPLIAQIVEIWRQRQDMVRAQSKLTLQAKAICRRFCAGDRKEAGILYAAITKDGDHPMVAPARIAVLALRSASVPLEEHRASFEKQLRKLGKDLPIAHMAFHIRGVNHLTLATIVGELGDLSAYEKGVAGIWKRAGLAVIGGERQRRKTGDEALLHGYSASRRSVLWNVGNALLKAQGKDENAGPYRQVYDARKAYERPRVESDGHAHNRALRFMTKRLLRDLWREWRAVVGRPVDDSA